MNRHTTYPGPAPVLAFDVGGTDIKSGIVHADHGIVGLKRTRTPHSASDPGEAVLQAIAHLASQYREENATTAFEAIGIVVPGLVDEDRGIGILSSNLGWKEFPFAARATELLDARVGFGHDVGAAGEAEFLFGAAKDSTDAVVVVNGTGIAAALFCDGRRVRGGGYAGELGHALVPDPDDPKRTVLLESIGSAGAIAHRYSEAAGSPTKGAREVLRLALSGNSTAKRIWGEGIHALAFSIAQMVCILGTETVVIGGGLAQAGDALFDPLRSSLYGQLTLPRHPRVVPAVMGENAGLLGAALKARQAAEPGTQGFRP